MIHQAAPLIRGKADFKGPHSGGGEVPSRNVLLSLSVLEVILKINASDLQRHVHVCIGVRRGALVWLGHILIIQLQGLLGAGSVDNSPGIYRVIHRFCG